LSRPTGRVQTFLRLVANRADFRFDHPIREPIPSFAARTPFFQFTRNSASPKEQSKSFTVFLFVSSSALGTARFRRFLSGYEPRFLIPNVGTQDLYVLLRFSQNSLELRRFCVRPTRTPFLPQLVFGVAMSVFFPSLFFLSLAYFPRSSIWFFSFPRLFQLVSLGLSPVEKRWLFCHQLFCFHVTPLFSFLQFVFFGDIYGCPPQSPLPPID